MSSVKTESRVSSDPSTNAHATKAAACEQYFLAVGSLAVMHRIASRTTSAI